MLAAVGVQYLDPLIHQGLQNGEILILSSLPYLLAEIFLERKVSLIYNLGAHQYSWYAKGSILSLYLPTNYLSME